METIFKLNQNVQLSVKKKQYLFCFKSKSILIKRLHLFLNDIFLITIDSDTNDVIYQVVKTHFIRTIFNSIYFFHLFNFV